MSNVFRRLALVLVLAGFGLVSFAAVSTAQTINNGYTQTAESSAGARFRSFGNSGGRELFLGVTSLGVGANRNEIDITWVSGSNDVTFSFDPVMDEIEMTVDNSAGSWALVYSSLSTQLSALGKTFTTSDFDYLQIDVSNRDLGAGTDVDLVTVDVNGNALGDFTTDNPSFVTWQITDFDFSQAFTVTGTIELAGSYSSSQERGRVELTVGKANICGNGVLELTEACDDGNTDDGDCCSSSCELETGSCDDGDLCTLNDTCSAGVCQGLTLDCSGFDDTCNVGMCDAGTGTCLAVPTNEGGSCDDADACTITDVCVAGTCTGTSSCGDGVVDPLCGETCDPPDGSTCDLTCQSVVCGNGIVQSGEECDDGNLEPADGCGTDCSFEEKFCFVGTEYAVSRGAKVVAFSSDFDYLGTNGDGNVEIFAFSKKAFDKALKKLVKQGADSDTAAADLIANRTAEFFAQLTNTPAGVTNEQPTVNGNGRVVAFASDQNTLGTNADGNIEIFRLDRKRGDLVQVTVSENADSRRANLRAARGNLLMFDSTADLVPDVCVGGENDLEPCSTDADCGPGDGLAGICGNPDGNREVFIYIQTAAKQGGVALRQLTAAPSGDSIMGRGANFNTRATAFTSTADFFGTNADGNEEIYRIIRDAEGLIQITSVTDAALASESPTQSKKRVIAFTSNADLAGTNPDGNGEIFAWRDANPPTFEQVTDTAGCDNDAAAVDARGRFFAFHSECDYLPSVGNPDQSIFVFDDRRGCFLPLFVRGPLDATPATTPAALPQVSKRVRVLTYTGNAGASDESICFFNTRDLFKKLPDCQ